MCFWGPFWWGRLIVLVAVITLVFILLRRTGGRTLPPDSGFAHETPLDILKKRYARGEISKEQFEQMKRDIGA